MISTLRGSIAASMFFLNTIFWCVLLYLFALLRLIPGLREPCSKAMIWVGHESLPYDLHMRP